VCGDMTLTTFMFSSLSLLRWKWHVVPWAILIFCLAVVDISFLTSALRKIPYGGYVPLIIAAFTFFIMYTWKTGKEALRNRTKVMQIPFETLQKSLENKEIKRCKGTAVFLTAVAEGVPVSLSELVRHIPFIPKTIIFLTIEHKHVPNIKHVFIERLEVKGFYRVIAQYGYSVSTVSMKELLDQCNYILPELHLDINTVSFFLGHDKIRSNKSHFFFKRWKIKFFNMMLQIAHSAAATFKLPPKNIVFVGAEQFM